ncbi:MAG: hypothetical protein IPI87_03240 [Betaproteobacteria bacterium]|nr:hypothetical protein [Betaproteobacteria bacterium]
MPWIVGSASGPLHGFGIVGRDRVATFAATSGAAALRRRGEIGSLIFVAALLAVGPVHGGSKPRSGSRLRMGCGGSHPKAIGGLSSVWLLQRIAGFANMA